MEGTGPTDRVASPLTARVEALSRDLQWTLAHFPFVADVTELAGECDIAHSPAMSVASCRSLPFQALAFLGESADLLANYATFLVDRGSAVYFLVNEEQRSVVQQAFPVLEEIPEWQLLFQGDPTRLEPGPAVPLRFKDLLAMQALAEAEGLLAFEKEPFARGPAFGVWEGSTLAAMGTTHLRVPGAAEIGNLVTRTGYRGRGYATAVTSALVRELTTEGLHVFLMVYQSNPEAVRLYRRLGFELVRPMYLMRCLIGSERDSTSEE